MSHPHQSETAAVRLNAAEAANRALELRKAGCTFKQIGAAMHFSEQRAHQIVTKELQRLNAKRAEAADEVRRLELDRLDTLFFGQWKNAQSGHQGAVKACLDIMARRAKILGLDAPTKIAPTTPDGTAPYAQIKVVYDGDSDPDTNPSD